MDQVRQVEGVPVLALPVDAADPKTLRDFAVKFQDKLKSGIVVLGSAAGDKAMLIALVTKDLTKRFPAGEIIKAIAPVVGGSGGGRPDMAQAGGPDKDKIPAALEQVYEVVAQKGEGVKRRVRFAHPKRRARLTLLLPSFPSCPWERVKVGRKKMKTSGLQFKMISLTA